MLSVENRKWFDIRTLGEILYFFADKLSLTSEELGKLLDAFLVALTKDLKWGLHLCS